MPGLAFQARADAPYIDSVAAAIDSANGQARIALHRGYFQATSGSDAIELNIPGEMVSTFKFVYTKRVLVSASWVFSQDVLVTLRSMNKCVTIRVRKLSYEEGGFIGGDTDETIVPSGPCRQSEPLARLDDFLGLTTDPGDLFRGRIFHAINKMRKCTDQACKSFQSGIPIRKVDFYGSLDGKGNPLSALRADFKQGSTVLMPSGFLALSSGSSAQFDQFSYDLDNVSGEALLSHFAVYLDDGSMEAGDTVLRFSPQSHLIAEEVKISKDNISVSISRGSFDGQLGKGSSIIVSSQDHKSVLNLQNASAKLVGLEFAAPGGRPKLSFASGILDTQVTGGELWFTDRDSVRLGYNNLSLVLGCQEGDGPACKPVSWEQNKLDVHGTIKAFSAQAVGGEFNVTSVGTVYLKSGQISADDLRIDTTDKTSPITGTLNHIDAAIEGQSLQFDGKLSASLVSVTVKGDNLIFKKGQSLPIGEVHINGTIDNFQSGNLGQVHFTTGATLALTVARKESDEPEITDGSVVGDGRAAMAEGNYVHLKIEVSALRYYRGHGDAMFTVTALDASYAFSTPAAHRDESAAGFKASVDIKSIRLVPALAQPVVLGPSHVTASQGGWAITPLTEIPFKLKIPISEQELVYAPISTPVGGTLCAPKVNLRAQEPNISGKLDVFATNAGRHVRVYDNQLSAGIDATADDRGCEKIGVLVCGLVGTALAGPIGGAGLAVLCKDKIDDGKAELSDKIRDESVKKISETSFDLSK